MEEKFARLRISANVSFLFSAKFVSLFIKRLASFANRPPSVEADTGRTSSIDGRISGPSISTKSPPKSKIRSGFGIGAMLVCSFICD